MAHVAYAARPPPSHLACAPSPPLIVSSTPSMPPVCPDRHGGLTTAPDPPTSSTTAPPAPAAPPDADDVFRTLLALRISGTPHSASATASAGLPASTAMSAALLSTPSTAAPPSNSPLLALHRQPSSSSPIPASSPPPVPSPVAPFSRPPNHNAHGSNGATANGNPNHQPSASNPFLLAMDPPMVSSNPTLPIPPLPSPQRTSSVLTSQPPGNQQQSQQQLQQQLPMDPTPPQALHLSAQTPPLDASPVLYPHQLPVFPVNDGIIPVPPSHDSQFHRGLSPPSGPDAMDSTGHPNGLAIPTAPDGGPDANTSNSTISPASNTLNNNGIATGSSGTPTGNGTPRIKNDLYKTEICRSFTENGGFCKYGSKCQFAHGEEELRPVRRHPRYKTKLCRNFSATGRCPYEQRCRFIHAPSDFVPAAGPGGVGMSSSPLGASGILPPPTIPRPPPLAADQRLADLTAMQMRAAMGQQPQPQPVQPTHGMLGGASKFGMAAVGSNAFELGSVITGPGSAIGDDFATNLNVHNLNNHHNNNNFNNNSNNNINSNSNSANDSSSFNNNNSGSHANGLVDISSLTTLHPGPPHPSSFILGGNDSASASPPARLSNWDSFASANGTSVPVPVPVPGPGSLGAASGNGVMNPERDASSPEHFMNGGSVGSGTPGAAGGNEGPFLLRSATSAVTGNGTITGFGNSLVLNAMAGGGAPGTSNGGDDSTITGVVPPTSSGTVTTSTGAAADINNLSNKHNVPHHSQSSSDAAMPYRFGLDDLDNDGADTGPVDAGADIFEQLSINLRAHAQATEQQQGSGADESHAGSANMDSADDQLDGNGITDSGSGGGGGGSAMVDANKESTVAKWGMGSGPAVPSESVDGGMSKSGSGGSVRSRLPVFRNMGNGQE